MSCFSTKKDQSRYIVPCGTHQPKPLSRPCVSLSPFPKKLRTHAIVPQVPVLTNQERLRLKNASKIVTVEERLDALAKQEELTRNLNIQADKTRESFRKIDEKHLAESIPAEAADGTSIGDKRQILEHSFLAKQEQEEEVKAANRFILHAKCQSIRDAQLQEKMEIERNQRKEEERLARIVLETNQKALAQEDTFTLAKKQRSEKYAREIRSQLLERENLRFLESERAEEDAVARRRASEILKQEEELRKRQAKERREKFRSELDRIVEMSNVFKKMICEQEREADLRVAAYMREKREREKQLELQKKLAREEFERKQKLLYQLAQKLMASKSEREEVNLLREQEHAEREYRRREMESALLRKRLEQEIRESRERQSQEMKTRQALQIAREEKDFMVMIENLKKEEQRLAHEQNMRAKRQACHLLDIKRQISDKAAYHQRLLEYARNEGKMLRDSERQRLQNVQIVIGAKLAAMREACLPEHYIKDVERQIEKIIKRSQL